MTAGPDVPGPDPGPVPGRREGAGADVREQRERALARALAETTVRGRPAAEARALRELPPDPYTFWELLRGDYEAAYAYKGESARAARLLLPLRMLTNASLHANLLIRLVQKAPGATTWFWRRLLLALHGCDVGRQTRVGPGLRMTHPTGIVIGVNTFAGRDVTIMQGATLSPVTLNWRGGHIGILNVGDDVTVFANAGIFGELVVGDGAIVGAGAVVSADVPREHLVAQGGRTRPAREHELAGIGVPRGGAGPGPAA